MRNLLTRALCALALLFCVASATRAEVINVKAPPYSAAGDGRVVNDAVTNRGSTTVTSATAAFNNGDVGKVVWALNASGAFVIPTGTVTGYSSPTSITVSGAANASATGVTLGLATNDTRAITNAVSACNAAKGCVLYFPRGRYVDTASHTLSYSTIVRGDGMGHFNSPSGDITTVTGNGTTQTLFTFNGMAGALVDITLHNVSSTKPISGAAVVIAHASLPYNKVDIRNVMLSGFYDGVDIRSGAGWAIDNLNVYDSVRDGIRISNQNNVDAGDWSLSNSIISTGRYSGRNALRIESSGGGKITNLKVNGDAAGTKFGIGIETTPVTGTGILKLDNISVENVSTGGIKIAGWDRVDVSNYQFGIYTQGSAAYALFFDSVEDSGYDNITAFTVAGAGAPAVMLNDCSRISKGHIQATGFNPWLSVSGTYTETGYTHNNGWTSVTFQNGWANLGGGYAPCQYAQQNNVVHVKCGAQAGAVGSVMFTLPAGFRPSETIYFPAYEGGATKFISIDSSGQVTHAGGSNRSVIFYATFIPK